MDRLTPGLVAVLVAVLVALVGLVPWIAWVQRRGGRLSLRRAVSDNVIVLSVLGIATYTLMPVPLPRDLTCAHPIVPQLLPFAAVGDAIRRPESALQLLFNIALFAPLGAATALRRAGSARRALTRAVLAGCVLSALVETTQLTGVWGIYPCAFRVFDVDDVLANTAGSAIGAVVLLSGAGLLRKRRLSGRTTANRRPDLRRVARRLVALLCDAVVAVVGGWVASLTVAAVVAVLGADPLATWARLLGPLALTTPAIVQLVVLSVRGRTIGEWAVGITSPAFPRRTVLLRWALGVGGWCLLVAPRWEVTGAVAIVAAIAAVTTVVVSRGRLSVASLVLLAASYRTASARRAARSAGGVACRTAVWLLAALVVVVPLVQIGEGTQSRRPADEYVSAQNPLRAFRDAVVLLPGSPLGGIVLDTDSAGILLRGDVGAMLRAATEADPFRLGR